MIAELVVAFIAGGVSHKLWRVAWRKATHPVTLRRAFTDEFAPPSPEQIDERNRRLPRISEVV